MKKSRGEVQVFSVSFLDVLSCALGGTLLLLLLLLQDSETTRFWVLTIKIQNTVDAQGRRTAERFDAKYYALLKIDNDKITGKLCGVEDLRDGPGADSFGQAEIKGTLKGDKVKFDLKFTGEAEGDIERITATLDGKHHMEGRLTTVKTMGNHRGYEGKVNGIEMMP